MGDWKDKDNSKINAITGGNELGFDEKTMKVQNIYEPSKEKPPLDVEGYRKALEEQIEESQSATAYRGFYVTFLSASEGNDTPKYWAEKVNNEIKIYLAERRDKGKYGAVVMDFPSHGLLDEIISNNPASGNSYSPCQDGDVKLRTDGTPFLFKDDRWFPICGHYFLTT